MTDRQHNRLDELTPNTLSRRNGTVKRKSDFESPMPRKINRPEIGKTPSKVTNGDGPTYVLEWFGDPGSLLIFTRQRRPLFRTAECRTDYRNTQRSSYRSGSSNRSILRSSHSSDGQHRLEEVCLQTNVDETLGILGSPG